MNTSPPRELPCAELTNCAQGAVEAPRNCWADLIHADLLSNFDQPSRFARAAALIGPTTLLTVPPTCPLPSLCSRSPRRATVTLSKWQPLPKQRRLRHKALPVSGSARRRGVDYRIPIVPVHDAWNAVLGPRQLLAHWRVCVLPWLGWRRLLAAAVLAPLLRTRPVLTG